jgi:hypothetical protein
MVVTRHLVCVRYTTDSSGRQTCAQQETQTTETQVPVGGALHFERIVKDGRGRGGPRG